jgi:hypothetical protein
MRRVTTGLEEPLLQKDGSNRVDLLQRADGETQIGVAGSGRILERWSGDPEMEAPARH